MIKTVSIHWFRRDLRLQDNAALYHALKAGLPLVPIFIFDTNILNKIEDKRNLQVSFIYQQVKRLHQELQNMGSTLEVYYGSPEEVFSLLAKKYNLKSVYTNNDYESYARLRDAKVSDLLLAQGIQFYSYKDQVIFEKDEVVKDDQKPYTVFTPYSKKWKSKLNDFYVSPYDVDKYLVNLHKQTPYALPCLESMGFELHLLDYPTQYLQASVLATYHETRDFPAIEGTSRLGVHLRFGTISIRNLVSEASSSTNEVFMNELIWREFYQCITWHFPHIGRGEAFKIKYDGIKWRNIESEFARWQEGQTGYPMVDAGMRELNATGFMHNRVRMVCASFLSKHLLIDWRWGEAYFESKLLDFDFAANNGGWQWASGSGCDAAPYFRVFNPSLQAKKFDPQLTYIRRWVAEFQEFTYPKPMVDHAAARLRALDAYATALK
ncbi:deoxyribodipyrimidine photolyase FAD-binding [Bacteroidales bacterium]|nr:deoxyribodipyrimidine photolyase FAD-binding [Bacteroidales bacterium]